jgi:hypothetical protein
MSYEASSGDHIKDQQAGGTRVASYYSTPFSLFGFPKQFACQQHNRQR